MRISSNLSSDFQREAGEHSDALNQLLGEMTAEYGNAPMSELAALLAFLRAESWVHTAHHWQTRGCNYYGDHLLFQRIYEETDDLIDPLAEKTIGTSGSHLFVQPCIQGLHMMAALKMLYAGAPVNPGADEYPWLSLRAVMLFLLFEKLVYESLEKQGKLSHGIDNLLQGFADKHEEFAYLLKQRVKGKTAGTPTLRSAAWKV